MIKVSTVGSFLHCHHEMIIRTKEQIFSCCTRKHIFNVGEWCKVHITCNLRYPEWGNGTSSNESHKIGARKFQRKKKECYRNTNKQDNIHKEKNEHEYKIYISIVRELGFAIHLVINLLNYYNHSATVNCPAQAHK